MTINVKMLSLLMIAVVIDGSQCQSTTQSSQSSPMVPIDLNSVLNGSSEGSAQLTDRPIAQTVEEVKVEDNQLNQLNNTNDGLNGSVIVLTEDRNSSQPNDDLLASEVRLSNLTSNETLLPIQNNENVSAITSDGNTVSQPSNDKITEERRRLKRSYLKNYLHSNLDELLNMKRQRRSSMRPKRNTDYEDLLASILASEEAKHSDREGYGQRINGIPVRYVLNNDNSDDSDNKYIDLDQLSQYYYQNLLPLLERVETDSETTDTDDNESQEVPVIVQPYSQSIPVIPYSYPNRYQRIRRNYLIRNRWPISVYSGMKRKRGRNSIYRGNWGRIVGANADRSAYEDEAQEASKIYSLASLLATGNLPEEYRQNRYKRSLRSAKTVIKNM